MAAIFAQHQQSMAMPLDGDFIPLDNDGVEDSDEDGMAHSGHNAHPHHQHHSSSSASSFPFRSDFQPMAAAPSAAPKRKAGIMLEDSMMDFEVQSAETQEEDGETNGSGATTPPSRASNHSPSAEYWPNTNSATPFRGSKLQRTGASSRSGQGSPDSFLAPSGTLPGDTELSMLRARVHELERLLSLQASDRQENAASAAQQYSQMETKHLVDLQMWENRVGEMEERLIHAGETISLLRKENEQLRTTIQHQALEHAQKSENLRAELNSILSKTKEPFQVVMAQYKKLATLTELVASETAPHGTLEEL